MELKPIYHCVAAIDVHQAKLTVCILSEDKQRRPVKEIREFNGFKRDRNAMAEWIASCEPEEVVMESTGIYWKSPYAALEKVGIHASVVNARHVKQVPGRKTDICDAQWLATLARSGLLRGGFVPKDIFRGLRLISRQMQKMTRILADEKNRMHKVLTDGGIRLDVVVSDIHGMSARQMLKGILNGEDPEQVLRYAHKRLKATHEELLDALSGELTEHHIFVVGEILDHIEDLERRIELFRQQLIEGLQPYRQILQALETIPGIDEKGAAMMLVEIGDDMQAFGSAEKLASWAGVCPGNHESAGKRVSGKKRKGNPYVRRILCEAANAISRTRCGLSKKFKSLLVRRGRKRAIFALAHKILKIIFVIISRGDYYRDATIDYEALTVKKNAPRWMKMLKKYGYLPA